VHSVQTAKSIDTISFAYDSLSQILLKFGLPFLTIPPHILPQSGQNVVPLKIAAEWLEIAQWSQWRVYGIGNHHLSFEWYRR